MKLIEEEKSVQDRLVVVQKHLDNLFERITNLQMEFEYEEQKIFQLLKEEEKLKLCITS